MAEPNVCGNCSPRSMLDAGWFTDLDESVLDALSSVRAEVVEYSGTESIYHMGSAARHLFVVYEGHVKLFKTSVNGKEQIIRIVKRGDVFGFDGLVDACYNHSAIPIRQVKVCRLSMQRFQLIKEQNPEIERAIMVRCIKELQHAEERLLQLGSARSPERLASFLLAWCESLESDVWTPLVLSRMEIAQLLGLTIETVSRLLAQWKREGIIQEKRQSIQLSNIGRLKQMAEMSTTAEKS